MKNVLVSGASFAGLCTAYWMNKQGYQVTIVEIAPGLKKGGTPVNILENTIEITKRMGILDQIVANRLHMESLSLKNAADVSERLDYHQERDEVEYEIERDFFLHLLYDLVKGQVKFIWSDNITGLQEIQEHMAVNFKNAPAQNFDLVFGCDGIHSAVRKYWFGEESLYAHFLQAYFSISITDKLLIPENTTQMYSEPGQTVMLNAYNGKTDICLCFRSEKEIPYDYRNEQQMRNIILENFKDTGWRTPELLEEVQRTTGFYFDKLCQMKMPSWTKGRVALVGDAGYCPSPAAGRGGSIAIDGAAALADAFEKCHGDHEKAFREYDQSFRPFIEEIQAQAAYGLEALIPRTAEAIHKRNSEGLGF